MSTAEDLRATAQVLRERGIHYGFLVADLDDPENCPVCPLGAMYVVVHGVAFVEHVHEPSLAPRLQAMLAALGFEDGYELAVWNDFSRPTLAGVIATLEARASELGAQNV
jgi:hypothetical protein